MSNQVQSSASERRLQNAEKLAVFLSFGGAIVGFIIQKYFIVFTPICCSLLLNIINKQKMVELLQRQYKGQIQTLNSEYEALLAKTTQLRDQQTKEFKKMEKSHSSLSIKLDIAKDRIKKLELSLIEVNKVSKNLDNSIFELNRQQKDIDSVVQELRVLGNSDERESSGESPANFHCKRGLIYHEKQKYLQALSEFEQALRIDAEFASAYHHSGITHLALGNKHKAFENLRKASQLYFAENNLDQYHQVRRLSKELYYEEENGGDKISINSANSPESKLAVDDLFS